MCIKNTERSVEITIKSRSDQSDDQHNRDREGSGQRGTRTAIDNDVVKR